MQTHEPEASIPLQPQQHENFMSVTPRVWAVLAAFWGAFTAGAVFMSYSMGAEIGDVKESVLENRLHVLENTRRIEALEEADQIRCVEDALEEGENPLTSCRTIIIPNSASN